MKDLEKGDVVALKSEFGFKKKPTWMTVECIRALDNIATVVWFVDGIELKRAEVGLCCLERFDEKEVENEEGEE